MKLAIEQGELTGQEFILDRPLTVIGRGRQSHIILPEPMASRQHAQITHDPQGWLLTDLGSTNGTLIDGRAIGAHSAHPLQPGSRVTIGNSVLVLREVPSRAAGAAGPDGGQRQRRTILIAGAALVAVVLVALAVLLVLAFRPESEGTQPGVTDSVQEVQTGLPLPTELEEIMTSMAVPTELEGLTTALPIPTDLEEMTTAMPMPTDLGDLMTSMPTIPAELPKLPLGATATP
jgi:hypothetical protein